MIRSTEAESACYVGGKHMFQRNWCVMCEDHERRCNRSEAERAVGTGQPRARRAQIIDSQPVRAGLCAELLLV